MSKGSNPTTLPASLIKAEAGLAASGSVALSQFIAFVMAKKVGRLRTAWELRSERAETAKFKGMLKHQRRSPTLLQVTRLG